MVMGYQEWVNSRGPGGGFVPSTATGGGAAARDTAAASGQTIGEMSGAGAFNSSDMYAHNWSMPNSPEFAQYGGTDAYGNYARQNFVPLLEQNPNAIIPKWAIEHVIPWRERGYPPGSFNQRSDGSWVTPDGRGPGDTMAAQTGGFFGRFPTWNGVDYDEAGTYRPDPDLNNDGIGDTSGNPLTLGGSPGGSEAPDLAPVQTQFGPSVYDPANKGVGGFGGGQGGVKRGGIGKNNRKRIRQRGDMPTDPAAPVVAGTPGVNSKGPTPASEAKPIVLRGGGGGKKSPGVGPNNRQRQKKAAARNPYGTPTTPTPAGGSALKPSIGAGGVATPREPSFTAYANQQLSATPAVPARPSGGGGGKQKQGGGNKGGGGNKNNNNKKRR